MPMLKFPGIALALVLSLPASPAIAADFLLAPDQPAVGALGSYTIQPGDTLPDIARRYDLGFTQLQAANLAVDPWLPRVGTRILLPSFYILPDAPRVGIVIDLAAQRLFYFPRGGGSVETYPIGIAVDGSATPLGVTRVASKQANPRWYPPASIRAEEPDLPDYIPPGPDNPLGAYALLLGWSGYLIHGTNKPDGVGRNVSHGCIHLYPEDIERLFHEVPVGTPVRVIDQTTEAAWIGGALYVEVHPSHAQIDEIDLRRPVTRAIPGDLTARVAAAAGDREGDVDWPIVERAGLQRSGLPVRIDRPGSSAPGSGPVESSVRPARGAS